MAKRLLRTFGIAMCLAFAWLALILAAIHWLSDI